MAKVHCNCCHKEIFKPQGFSTPYGAMIFSCGKKRCDAVITEVLVDCFGLIKMSENVGK